MAGEQLDNLQEKVNWHWRNTMRTVRFIAYDARSALPLPLLLVYARMSTLVLTFVTLTTFRYLERKGLTFPSAMRALRRAINGEVRYGVLPPFKKRFRDFG